MEATASDIAQQDSVKTAKIKVIRNHQFILIFRSRLCRMIKKRGQAPVQFGAIGFQSRSVIGAVPSAGHARRLRTCGSRDPPAACGDRTGGLRTKVRAIRAWPRALQKPTARGSVRWES
jgi:hypothetical protein